MRHGCSRILMEVVFWGGGDDPQLILGSHESNESIDRQLKSQSGVLSSLSTAAFSFFRPCNALHLAALHEDDTKAAAVLEVLLKFEEEGGRERGVSAMMEGREGGREGGSGGHNGGAEGGREGGVG